MYSYVHPTPGHAGVKQADATMAVLLQEMLQPELSFVLHTQNPMDRQDSAPSLGHKPSPAHTL